MLTVPKVPEGQSIHFNKSLNGPFWKRGKSDGVAVALFRCPCGIVSALESHTVHADGHVEPSVWHDAPECGFHEHITLEGYAAE